MISLTGVAKRYGVDLELLREALVSVEPALVE